MSILEEKKEDFILLTVNSPSLAGNEANELKAKAVSLLDAGKIKISLDLKKPEFIDSSGIGKLLFMNKKIKKLNGEFSISKINSTLYEFLESLAITQVMDIADPS